FTSAPALSLSAGQGYRYDVAASDPDGNALTYRPDAAPAGKGLDSPGPITPGPAPGDLGPPPGPGAGPGVFGASARPSLHPVVSADTQAPNVFVNVSPSRAELGSQVTIFVSATDNVGVTDLVLTVNGTPVTFDPNGEAVFDADQVGAFDVQARATDAAGNTG